MAKMFYTMDETKAALGRSEDEIKNLSREGRLREFRDGARLMFKADQVEALKAELGDGEGSSGDHIDLGPSDSGAPIGLADSNLGPSGTSITLTDSDLGPSPGGGMKMKEDTALAADLGLSGSMGGVPSPGRISPGGSISGLSGTSPGRSGITVFQPDEVEHADPMAQTNIAGSMADQVNLEGVGSGSGLLDLTRESDDTSLGAELLDEIAPAPTPRRGRAEPAAGGTELGLSSGMGMETMEAPATTRRGSAISQPIVVEKADPLAPAFAGLGVGAVIAMLFAAFALTSATVGVYPDYVKAAHDYNFGMVFLFGLGLSVVCFVIGLVIGKMGTR